MSVVVEVEKFIVREISPNIGSVAHDHDLLAAEVIDSLRTVQLISFLESKHAIKVNDDDLDPENFASVDSIVMLVERKGV